MTESEFRINIAKNINNILTAIYKNIGNNEFDPLVNLENVPSTTLKDFWLYTAGFLGLKNQEDFDKMLTDQEVNDVLTGAFNLRTLPLDQAQQFAKRSKVKIPEKNSGVTINLYSVQDGTYSIKKGFKDENGNTVNYLSLKTDPLEYYTDKSLEEFSPNPREVLKSLRNVFAHRTPLKLGKKLLFEKGDDEIVVSKMWLRGYSELFCKKSHTLNSEDIENIISKEVNENSNTLSTKQDIDSVLLSIKHLFGEDINKNFYKLSNFVQTRIADKENFFNLTTNEKLKTLSAILANNFDYITTNTGYINPSIVYNLQQLVALELQARNEITDLNVEDYDVVRMKQVVNEVCALNERTQMVQTLFKTGKSFSKSAKQRYLKNVGSMKSKVKSYLKSLEDKQKLESENMELYNLEDLNSLPIEVAVNTVMLMCFNSLITSSFYDDILAKTNTNILNKNQEIFFDKFDTANLQFYYGDTQRKQQLPGQKAYLLICLREALCHGTISYKLPTSKKGEIPNFKDTLICFETSERQNSKIYGTVQNFYDLFSSLEFLAKRDKEIITGQQREMTFEEEELSKTDEENFKNLNSIVQELRFVDEQFKTL